MISATGIAVFACLVVVFLWRQRSAGSLSVIDLAVATYLLCSSVNALVVSRLAIDYFIWLKWIALAGLYVLVRNSADKNKIFRYIPIAGAVQSSIAIAQKAGIIESSQFAWSATGSFANPGHLGGFLCVCFIVTISLLANGGRKHAWLWIAIAVQIAGLIIADSRAAIVGVVAGGAMVMALYLPQCLKRYKYVLIAVGAVSVIAGLVFMYDYRRGSADGRLLIWRVSADMIAERPIQGHGVGRFVHEYMPQQADYFERHPESEYISVADNVDYAFNEFIHIAIEQGVIGLILFGTVLALVFRSKRNFITKSGIAAWCGFALFSYPAEIFPIMILFAILLACADSKAVCRLTSGRAASLPAAALCMVYCVEILNLTHIEKSLHRSDLPALERHFDKMKHNPAFNTLYFDRYVKEMGTDVDFQRLAYAIPGCEGYCVIGELHERRGEYPQAEKLYLAAANMTPGRITPNHNLWRLYTKTARPAAARRMALKIVAQPVKVESSYTARIKDSMQKFLYGPPTPCPKPHPTIAPQPR